MSKLIVARCSCGSVVVGFVLTAPADKGVDRALGKMVRMQLEAGRKIELATEPVKVEPCKCGEPAPASLPNCPFHYCDLPEPGCHPHGRCRHVLGGVVTA